MKPPLKDKSIENKTVWSLLVWRSRDGEKIDAKSGRRKVKRQKKRKERKGTKLNNNKKRANNKGGEK